MSKSELGARGQYSQKGMFGLIWRVVSFGRVSRGCRSPSLHSPKRTLSGDSEKIEILVWPLVVALAYCLYAPELDIQ